MQLLDIHEPGETPLPHAGDHHPAVGIDLGTTHSVVAVARGGVAEVLRDAAGRALLPSVVAYADGVVTVGADAKAQLGRGTGTVIASIKRLMGRSAHEAEQLAGVLPFAVDAGEGMARVHVGEIRLTPVEISAEILRALKVQAEHALGHDVTQAVITVPAYFDDAARTATRDAARLAGLEVLRLINEPTAAALAYGLDQNAEGVYAIYDLGGGTFDVSLLKLEQGVFQVLATGGDAQLGGDDIDRLIAEFWLGGKAPEHAAAAQAWLLNARAAKEALTSADSTTINGHELERIQLETLAQPLIARTLAACGAVLADAKLQPKDVKGVVLVGGSTRMPLVRREVAAFFGQQPLANVNPDEVVAVGAALQAEGLTRGSDTLLLDVIPLSLGLETMGGIVEKIIPRNTPIPVAVAQEFTTYADGQQGMQMHVVQGERELADDCRSLARFEVSGIPPRPAGAARVKVTFLVDADGLLTVSAREETTGVEQQIAVKPSYGLDEDDMLAMLEAGMKHAQEDMNARLLREERVEAGRVIAAVRAALAQDGALLSETERREIEAAVLKAEQSCGAPDRHAIHEATHALEEATHAFAEQRMNASLGKALEGVGIDRLAAAVKSSS